MNGRNDAVAPSAPARATSSGSAVGLTKALAIEQGLRSKGVDPAKVHLPNFAGMVTNPAQPIAPSYTQAPAPMGVADIGLQNVSGQLVPYELNTTSVAGTVNITNLESLYVDGDGPDTYGIQLNSVVTNVTIFGNSSYQFWSQNYIGYTVSTQQLVFGDEVWNFSSPSGLFPQNSIYNFSVNGTFSDFPYLYQGYGPEITIGYPFALTLYLNTSVMGDRPVLYFNYTVSNDTFQQSASFDYLVFNSTLGTPTAPAPIPQYQADGYNYDPIGLINDMEIDILGNDDGDMTAFTAANATVSLQFWNESAKELQEVPSAYSAGQETGETSVGLLVYSSGGTSPIALVQAGPGFVGGLWNYSASTGAVAETITIHPLAEYSFLFVNVGTTEQDNLSQWVPTSTDGTGTTTFYLPTGGTYFLNVLMSEHNTASEVVTATTSGPLPTIHLVANRAMGVYTPLFAFSNAQLAAISSGGAGTAASPYIVNNNQYTSLSDLFGSWDDYLFPLFPGLLIADTNAWVDVTPASFEINLPSWDFTSPYVAALNLSSTNNLQIQFYDASNVSLVHASGILGWMSAFLAGFPESSVILWGCTNSTVVSNTFDDQGNALLLYGGTNNTVWGNSFFTVPVVSSDPAAVDGGGQWVTGINETENGDLVYNNYFDVSIPAITVTYDPFGCDQYGFCGTVFYNDTWNVSEQPASDYAIVNGWNLTGSIIGTWYEGGNFWSNYGTAPNLYGILPYNNSGAITEQGDYVPLVPFGLYPLTFQETGLPSGSAWNISENGNNITTTSTSFALASPNGTFALSFSGPAGYATVGAPVNVTVSGAAVIVSVTFAPLAVLGVLESGLVSGIQWSATVNGSGTLDTNLTFTSASSTIDFELTTGTYNISVGAPGYFPTPATMRLALGTGGVNVPFVFAPYLGTLVLNITPVNVYAYVDGSQVNLTNGNYTGAASPGVYAIVVVASGYLTYYNNVSVTSNQTTSVPIVLVSAPSSSSSSWGGVSSTGWVIIAALAALAAVLLVGLLYFARRARSAVAAKPTPAQAWQEAPPKAPPPPTS